MTDDVFRVEAFEADGLAFDLVVEMEDPDVPDVTGLPCTVWAERRGLTVAGLATAQAGRTVRCVFDARALGPGVWDVQVRAGGRTVGDGHATITASLVPSSDVQPIVTIGRGAGGVGGIAGGQGQAPVAGPGQGGAPVAAQGSGTVSGGGAPVSGAGAVQPGVGAQGAGGAPAQGQGAVAAAPAAAGQGGDVVVYSDDAAAVTALWSGVPSPDGLRASVKLGAPATDVRMVASPVADLSAGVVYGPSVASEGVYAKPLITGLAPDTAWYWGVRIGDTVYRANRGRFRTLPAAGAPASFRMVFGSCGDSPNSAIYTTINALDPRPRFVQHLGDLHYSDIAVNDVALFDAAYDYCLQGTKGVLMREVPFVYTWSDHDYGPNESSSTSPSRVASLAAFRKRAPVPDLWFPAAGGPIGYSYVVGRIRFVVPDLRSEKVDGTRILSAAQRQRMLDEITAAKAAGQFVILCCETSMTQTVDWPLGDRQALCNHIKDEGLEGRVLMLAGDAHAIQIDDGTNNDFATGGGGKVFTIHAAPFDRPSNSFKGGPFSHGRIAASTSQTGILDIVDGGGDTLNVTFTGIRENGTTVATFAFELSRTGWIDPGGNDGQGAVSGPVAASGSGTVGASGAGGQGSVSATPGASGEGTVTGTGGGGDGPVPTVVQTRIATIAAGTATRTAGFLSAPAPGNLMLLYVGPDKACTVATPADWTLIGTPYAGGTGVSGALFWKVAGAAEPDVTVTLGASTSHCVMAFREIAGAGAAPIDAVARTIEFATNTNVRRTGVMTADPTAGPNRLALAFMHNDSWGWTDAATGFAWSGAFATDAVSGFGAAGGATNAAPACALGSKALPAAGVVAATEFSYSGDGAVGMMGFLVTIRPT